MILHARSKHHASVEGRDQCFERHTPVSEHAGESADRQVAASADPGKELPFRLDGTVRVRLVYRHEPLERRHVVGATLDCERALPDLREHQRRVEDLGDLPGQAEPLQRRYSDHYRIVLAGLSQTRLDVAAQRVEPDVRADRCELRPPADGPRRDPPTGGDVVEARTDEGVTRVGALRHGGQQQPFRRR